MSFYACIMDRLVRDYLYSVKVELRKGRKVPILNFQLEVLINEIAKERNEDKEVIKSNLTRLLALSGRVI